MYIQLVEYGNWWFLLAHNYTTNSDELGLMIIGRDKCDLL